jgi:hypothetical protein
LGDRFQFDIDILLVAVHTEPVRRQPLLCPECSSDGLKIAPCAGFERFMIVFTNKRKYYCRKCSHAFRASDRRAHARQLGDAYSAANAAGILRRR